MPKGFEFTRFHWVNSLGPSDAIWRQRSGSPLAQVMACCLTAPSHYLNQCWLIMNLILWHLPENNFIGISHNINSINEFENYNLKFITVSPRCHRVNPSVSPMSLGPKLHHLCVCWCPGGSPPSVGKVLATKTWLCNNDFEFECTVQMTLIKMATSLRVRNIIKDCISCFLVCVFFSH